MPVTDEREDRQVRLGYNPPPLTKVRPPAKPTPLPPKDA